MILQFRPLILSLWLVLGISFGSTVHAAIWQQPPYNFNDSGPGTEIAIKGVTDGNGNAIALLLNLTSNTPLQASYFTNGAWGPNQMLSQSNSILGQDIAMDATGIAIAVWSDYNFGTVSSAYFKNGSWIYATPNPLGSITPIFTVQSNLVAVAMNGNGAGVTLFLDPATSIAQASFFLNGTWTTPVTVGTAVSGNVGIAYSAKGTAMAVWESAGMAIANYYNGSSFQGAVTLGTKIPGEEIGIGMDANGNAIASWIDATNNAVADTFNGTNWLAAPTLISANTNTSDLLSFAMAPNGTAVATWVDSGTSGLSNSYNGTSWGTVQQFTNNLTSGTNGAVSVDADGNALVVFGSNTFNAYSMQMPLGGTWGNPLTILSNSPNRLDTFDSALSLFGRGFAFFIQNNGEDPSDLLGSAIIVPIDPPQSISGKACTRNSKSIHVITWTASLDPTVVAYNVRRNGVLVATIAATDPLVYVDKSRCKRTDVYTVTAVNASGAESTPVTIILR